MSDQAQYPEHSYIRRRGRMTKSQAHGLQTLMPGFSCKPAELIAQAQGKSLGVEIGFGMGQALLDWAAAAPDWQLCGIELYQPGVGALAAGLHRQRLDNVRVIEMPAQQVLAQFAALDAGPVIDEVRIFFPDPWPKKRHFKRRLIQPEFVQSLAAVIRGGGRVRLATDWTPYAQWMRECFAANDAFVSEVDHIRQADEQWTSEIARQTTKFERRGEKLGHDIHDLIYRRSVQV
ncbi:MAG: tRNA (guanosine(46)-N7)-methyltransferase TrmB [bacterium]